MNYTRRTQIAPPEVNEIANESVNEMHLRLLSKIDLRVQMDEKSGQLKNESKNELFTAPGDTQESATGTTTNLFKMRLMIQFRVLIILLQFHPFVHFKIYIKMHKKVHLWMH